jgi:hypothetical protein
MGPARATAWVEAMGKMIRGEDRPDELAASIQQQLSAPALVDEQAIDSTALALLTRHGWSGDPNTTMPEAVQVVSDAVRTLEAAGLPR